MDDYYLDSGPETDYGNGGLSNDSCPNVKTVVNCERH